MNQVSTFNAYHLGDNLVHLNFLRRVALANPDRAFSHYAPPQHFGQLSPLVEDLPNLTLLNECPQDAINAWRGAGNFWHLHPGRNDFVGFHVDWFAHLAEKMGVESPIRSAADMRFDYPALDPEKATDHFQHPEFDVLLINSIPHSGQFRGFNPHDFTVLARMLVAAGKRVVTTAPTATAADSTHDGSSGLSITAIGRLSARAKAIVGMVTGPSWTCMNVHNLDKKFIWMLDDERVEIMPNTEHVRSCGEAMKLL